MPLQQKQAAISISGSPADGASDLPTAQLALQVSQRSDICGICTGQSRNMFRLPHREACRLVFAMLHIGMRGTHCTQGLDSGARMQLLVLSLCALEQQIAALPDQVRLPEGFQRPSMLPMSTIRVDLTADGACPHRRHSMRQKQSGSCWCLRFWHRAAWQLHRHGLAMRQHSCSRRQHRSSASSPQVGVHTISRQWCGPVSLCNNALDGWSWLVSRLSRLCAGTSRQCCHITSQTGSRWCSIARRSSKTARALVKRLKAPYAARQHRPVPQIWAASATASRCESSCGVPAVRGVCGGQLTARQQFQAGRQHAACSR